jgi:hypothetical protein
MIEKIWNKNCDFVNKERGEEGRLTFWWSADISPDAYQDER